MDAFKEKLLHKWLAVPYVLHATVRHPASNNAPTVLFIHGIGSSGTSWQGVIDNLPANYRIITIDLLGFGKSAQPIWATYSAKLQAKSVIATYLGLGIHGKVTIVGHSLGALVAVEFAKRYPLLVKFLVLCSPPFYMVDETTKRLLSSRDALLRDLYRIVKNHPEQFVKIAAMALKLGLVNKSFNLTPDNAPAYMNALEASIINQTTLQDAMKLKVPTHIIRGSLDPVVVAKNLRLLAKTNKLVTISTILASHEIQGLFIKATAKAIQKMIETKQPQ